MLAGVCVCVCVSVSQALEVLNGLFFGERDPQLDTTHDNTQTTQATNTAGRQGTGSSGNTSVWRVPPAPEPLPTRVPRDGWGLGLKVSEYLHSLHVRIFQVSALCTDMTYAL